MSIDVLLGSIWSTGFMFGLFVGYIIFGYRVNKTKDGKSQDFR